MKTTLFLGLILLTVMGYGQTPIKIAQPIRYTKDATFEVSPVVPVASGLNRAINLQQARDSFFTKRDTVSLWDYLSGTDGQIAKFRGDTAVVGIPKGTEGTFVKMIDGQPGWGDGVSIMGTPITNQVTMFSANGRDIENSLIGIWGTTVGVPNLEVDGKITIAGATSGAINLVSPDVGDYSTVYLPSTAGTLATLGANTFTGVQTMTSPVFTTPVLGTPSSGTMTNVSGTAANLTAGKATTLATARTINGIAFDGSANITIPVGTVILTGTPNPGSIAMFSTNGTGIENSVMSTWGTTVGVPNLSVSNKITIAGENDGGIMIAAPDSGDYSTVILPASPGTLARVEDISAFGTAIRSNSGQSIFATDITGSTVESSLFDFNYTNKNRCILIYFSAPFSVTANSQDVTVRLYINNTFVFKSKLNIFSNTQNIAFPYLHIVTPNSVTNIKVTWQTSGNQVFQLGASMSERIITVIDTP